uniref:Uncharacterized protein n=1 Tax=Noccaea caerulescens TaxID=107243 RepID=A0A1J3KBL9_NOCCA
MRDFYLTVNGPDLIDSLDLRAESSMNTKDLSIDDSSNGKVVKNFCAIFPRVRVTVLSVDLIIESIDGCDLSRLMIATKKSDPFWVFDLEAEQVFECFH